MNTGINFNIYLNNSEGSRNDIMASRENRMHFNYELNNSYMNDSNNITNHVKGGSMDNIHTQHTNRDVNIIPPHFFSEQNVSNEENYLSKNSHIKKGEENNLTNNVNDMIQKNNMNMSGENNFFCNNNPYIKNINYGMSEKNNYNNNGQEHVYPNIRMDTSSYHFTSNENTQERYFNTGMNNSFTNCYTNNNNMNETYNSAFENGYMNNGYSNDYIADYNGGNEGNDGNSDNHCGFYNENRNNKCSNSRSIVGIRHGNIFNKHSADAIRNGRNSVAGGKNINRFNELGGISNMPTMHTMGMNGMGMSGTRGLGEMSSWSYPSGMNDFHSQNGQGRLGNLGSMDGVTNMGFQNNLNSAGGSGSINSFGNSKSFGNANMFGNANSFGNANNAGGMHSLGDLPNVEGLNNMSRLNRLGDVSNLQNSLNDINVFNRIENAILSKTLTVAGGINTGGGVGKMNDVMNKGMVFNGMDNLHNFNSNVVTPNMSIHQMSCIPPSAAPTDASTYVNNVKNIGGYSNKLMINENMGRLDGNRMNNNTANNCVNSESGSVNSVNASVGSGMGGTMKFSGNPSNYDDVNRVNEFAPFQNYGNVSSLNMIPNISRNINGMNSVQGIPQLNSDMGNLNSNDSNKKSFMQANQDRLINANNGKYTSYYMGGDYLPDGSNGSGVGYSGGKSISNSYLKSGRNFTTSTNAPFANQQMSYGSNQRANYPNGSATQEGGRHTNSHIQSRISNLKNGGDNGSGSGGGNRVENGGDNCNGIGNIFSGDSPSSYDHSTYSIPYGYTLYNNKEQKSSGIMKGMNGGDGMVNNYGPRNTISFATALGSMGRSDVHGDNVNHITNTRDEFGGGNGVYGRSDFKSNSINTIGSALPPYERGNNMNGSSSSDIVQYDGKTNEEGMSNCSMANEKTDHGISANKKELSKKQYYANNDYINQNISYQGNVLSPSQHHEQNYDMVGNNGYINVMSKTKGNKIKSSNLNTERKKKKGKVDVNKKSGNGRRSKTSIVKTEDIANMTNSVSSIGSNYFHNPGTNPLVINNSDVKTITMSNEIMNNQSFYKHVNMFSSDPHGENYPNGQDHPPGQDLMPEEDHTHVENNLYEHVYQSNPCDASSQKNKTQNSNITLNKDIVEMILRNNKNSTDKNVSDSINKSYTNFLMNVSTSYLKKRSMEMIQTSDKEFNVGGKSNNLTNWEGAEHLNESGRYNGNNDVEIEEKPYECINENGYDHHMHVKSEPCYEHLVMEGGKGQVKNEPGYENVNSLREGHIIPTKRMNVGRKRKRGSGSFEVRAPSKDVKNEFKEVKRKGRKRKVPLEPPPIANSARTIISGTVSGMATEIPEGEKGEWEDINHELTLCCKTLKSEDNIFSDQNTQSGMKNMLHMLKHKLKNFNVKNSINSHSEINVLINNFLYVLRIINKHKQILENMYSYNFNTVSEDAVRSYLEKHFSFVKCYRQNYELPEHVKVEEVDEDLSGENIRTDDHIEVIENGIKRKTHDGNKGGGIENGVNVTIKGEEEKKRNSFKKKGKYNFMEDYDTTSQMEHNANTNSDSKSEYINAFPQCIDKSQSSLTNCPQGGRRISHPANYEHAQGNNSSGHNMEEAYLHTVFNKEGLQLKCYEESRQSSDIPIAQKQCAMGEVKRSSEQVSTTNDKRGSSTHDEEGSNTNGEFVEQYKRWGKNE
ncbi:conserved Plasmodium protein, unknown function [Plasmodium ovale]|uniref:Uncharacterized protein n=2 Tax=Plasmodium ovale TaxID=36330 RepID=A0A1A8WNE7_PLAOA|nr:conserved Plasmodium protein, unknown function [Plasmodium ovale curtisi]SCN43101.1 conserved Plasmodium protein, unknown function [Plasmodium ovale]